MLPFRLVYHEGYDLNFGDHVFPSQKYRLIRERLLNEGFAEPDDFVAPMPARESDLRLVHTEGWVSRLTRGTLSFDDIRKLEVPYSRQMVQAFLLAAGGTTLAGRLALRDGIGINIGGGFHHALPDHGEGFCAINDMAVAIRRLQREGTIERAMVVDCDVHQGNGTATLFRGDETVFTFSIHQEYNYPSPKEPGDLDIGLEDGAGDDEYLAELERALERVWAHEPGLVVYLAGADVFREDQLGGLGLTMTGLEARDRMVLEGCARRGLPVVITLGGGYARRLEDTVAIHLATCCLALRLARAGGATA